MHGRTSLWGREFCFLVAMYSTRRAQGLLGEVLEELVTRASDPAYVPLRPLAVLACVDNGDHHRARALMAQWGTEVGEDWTTDFLVPIWGLVAAKLGTPDRRALMARIEPYADQLMMIGTGATCWGPTRAVLAELAASLGDTAGAARHAAAAQAQRDRLGLVNPFAARVSGDQA